MKVYRKQQGGARPAWVENALHRSLTALILFKEKYDLADPHAELAFLSAEEDNLGFINVQLEQVFNDVPVFGGQLITSLDARMLRDVNGRIFKDAREVDTTPKMNAAQAIEIAKAELNYSGNFDKELTAKLVVLPFKVKDPFKVGATLCYLVELVVLNNTERGRIHRYFVDAKNGEVVWYYDNLQC